MAPGLKPGGLIECFVCHLRGTHSCPKATKPPAVPSAYDCAFTAPDTHTPVPSGLVSLTQFEEENFLPGAQLGVWVARATAKARGGF